ncbi:MAG TPA: YraN family protein [Kofleriaceae bacterium]
MQSRTLGGEPTKIEVGATSEDRAADLLVRKGMRIVERNYRCKVGELDIVARDGRVLVFVEVRSRRSTEFGSALDAISWAKRRKVTRVAMAYLARRRPQFDEARFDVVAITGEEIVHVEDAWRL